MTATVARDLAASSTAPRPTGRPDLAAAFARDGYVIVEEFLDEAALAATRAEALAICRGQRGDIDGVLPSVAGESDGDVLRRYQCIHFPHKISSQMLDIARSEASVDVLTQVIGPNVKLMQSMLFIKSEGKPGQAWHQDEYFIPTRDRSLAAIWIALDDATIENGCLWVIPGSHRAGVLYPDREHDSIDFDCSRESYGFSYAESDAVPVEIPAGAAVVFNGYLLHKSRPNTGRRGMRRALVNHYMSAESLLPWVAPAGDEWMGKADHRDVVLVAGEDPYAFKGTTDVFHPHVRPDREGGCVR
jgi:ectoine hydroxylase-related dioxygenase (phytanoyl-CoA dioxygenase family)